MTRFHQQAKVQTSGATTDADDFHGVSFYFKLIYFKLEISLEIKDHGVKPLQAMKDYGKPDV
jgi:hypothetical protein